jgi:hypothetical protein
MTATSTNPNGQEGGFTGDLNFDVFTNNTSHFLPPSDQEAESWPPIGQPHENVSSSLASMLDTPQRSNSWSPMMGSNRDLHSAASSHPLLSSPPGYRTDWTYIADGELESDGFSLRRWDTSSTLVSVSDPFNDEKDADFELEAEGPVDTNPSVQRPPRPAESLFRQFIPRAHPQIRLPRNHVFPELASISEAPESSGKYTCTDCKRGFNRKGDWKRHEVSHDPQTFWTCMLGDPAILSPAGWSCAFCVSSKQTRSEMVIHLIKEHKMFLCTNKPLGNRTFLRKDKLKQHLQQVHALSESSVEWETWHQATRKKWAWGCGFCGSCSFTWEGMSLRIFIFHSTIVYYVLCQPPVFCSVTTTNGNPTMMVISEYVFGFPFSVITRRGCSVNKRRFSSVILSSLKVSTPSVFPHVQASIQILNCKI